MHVSINIGEVLKPLALHQGRSLRLEYKQEYRTRKGKSSVTHTMYEVGFLIRDTDYWYEKVLISPYPDLLPDVVGRNRQCRWKEGSVHMQNCKSFLVTEHERKHVRRRARFQQHRDASSHQVLLFSCKARRRRKFTPF